MTWTQLQDVYVKRGIVVVLGAGVSVGCGLPAWPALLQRVIAQHLNNEVQVGELRAHGLSLPAIASLIEERMPDRHAFVEAVRDALYHGFPFYPAGVDKGNRRAFVRHIQETNPTLRTVAALCTIPSPSGRTFDANPRVHGLVTFNLDALLQAYVYAHYEKRLLRTVERPSAGSIPGKISIYHMHGFLRFDRAKGDLSKEAPDAVVLTEQDYFDFFNQPTSLFNYTFLYLLREHPCCFIGLSMQDDNIRRLLHYSKLEQYHALCHEGIEDKRTLRGKLVRHFAIHRRSGQPVIDRAIEQTLEPLGVKVMWVDEFAEIPERIGAMYEAAAESWDAVF